MKDIRYLVSPPQQPKFDLHQIMELVQDGILARETSAKDKHDYTLKEIRATRNAQNQYRDMILTAIANIKTDLTPVLNAIRAIPRTDLTPAIDAVKGIKLPEIPKPEKVDLTPVQQQIDRLSIALDALTHKVDAIDVRPIVATSAQKPVVVKEQPKTWHFTVVRNSGGGIKEVVATSD